MSLRTEEVARFPEHTAVPFLNKVEVLLPRGKVVNSHWVGRVACCTGHATEQEKSTFAGDSSLHVASLLFQGT